MSATDLFAWVCGQNPSHLWVPGGVALPCCQRCTGLYVGALAAVLLHRLVRPRASLSFLVAHGLFLLQMLPCGLYWLPQGPALRALSGVLAGFGMVGFLMPAARMPEGVRWGGNWTYGGGLAATMVGLLWAAEGNPELLTWYSQFSAIIRHFRDLRHHWGEDPNLSAFFGKDISSIQRDKYLS